MEGTVDPMEGIADDNVDVLWNALNLGDLLQKEKVIPAELKNRVDKEYEKKITKANYKAVIQRYDSKPTKPRVIKKDTLNRLADPIKYRYNQDNGKGQENQLQADIENRPNASNQGPVIVKKGDNGQISISINPEAIKAGDGDGPIKIQLPPEVIGSYGAGDGIFLTGGNETPIENVSKVTSKLQQARRMDQNVDRTKRNMGSFGAPPRKPSNRLGSNRFTQERAMPARESGRASTKPRIPRQTSYPPPRGTDGKKPVITYDSKGHAMVNGKPRKRVSVRSQGKSSNLSGMASRQMKKQPSALGFKKPSSTFLTGGDESDTTDASTGKRKYLKKGSRKAITVKADGRLPRVNPARKVVDARVFSGIPAKIKGKIDPYAPLVSSVRVKSTSSLQPRGSQVNLQRVDRDQELLKSQSAQSMARKSDRLSGRGSQEWGTEEKQESPYGGKSVNYPQRSGQYNRDRSRERGSSKDRGRNSRSDSRDRINSNRDNSRGRDGRNNSRDRGRNARSDSRDRINSNRDNSRGKGRNLSSEFDRNSGSRSGSGGGVQSTSLLPSLPPQKKSEKKSQQNEFYEQITAKKKEELLNYLRGEMDESLPGGGVSVLPPLQVLSSQQPQQNAEAEQYRTSIAESLQKLQAISSSQQGTLRSDEDAEESMLAVLATHAKKLSDKIDKVDRKLEDYSKLKAPPVNAPPPVATTQPVPIAAVSPKASPSGSLGKHSNSSPSKDMLNTWKEYDDEETALAQKIENIREQRRVLDSRAGPSVGQSGPDETTEVLMREYDDQEVTLRKKIDEIKKLKLNLSRVDAPVNTESPGKISRSLIQEYQEQEVTLQKKIDEIKRLKTELDSPQRKGRVAISPERARKLWAQYTSEEAALTHKIAVIRKLRAGENPGKHMSGQPKMDLHIFGSGDDEEAAITRKINEINAKKQAKEALDRLVQASSTGNSPEKTKFPDVAPDASPLHLEVDKAVPASLSFEERREAEHFASLINRNLMAKPEAEEKTNTVDPEDSVGSIESILSTLDVQAEIRNEVKKSKMGAVTELLMHKHQIGSPKGSKLKNAVRLAIDLPGASPPLQRAAIRKISPITVPAENPEQELKNRQDKVAALNSRHMTPPAEEIATYDPLAAHEVDFDINNETPADTIAPWVEEEAA